MNAQPVNENIFDFVHDRSRLLPTVSAMLHPDHLSGSPTQYCMHKFGHSYLE